MRIFREDKHAMSHDMRFLSLNEVAAYLGRTPRWIRRHYVDLIKAGVEIYRVPKGAIKGRIMFGKDSLDRYIEKCQLRTNLDISV